MSALEQNLQSELPEVLARHCEALMHDLPDARSLEQAQRRLEEKTAARPVRVRPAWFGAVAAAACAVVVLVAMPLLTDRGEAQGAAFAIVQQNLREFRTLDMRIEQRFGGEPLINTRVRVARDGAVRTDIGRELSVIVGSARVTTLLHDSREALVAPLVMGTRRDEDALAWLREIEKFKGASRSLPDSRRIDGQIVHGWRLDARGMPVELWADAQGWPREMKVGGKSQLELRFRFEFNTPFEADVLSTAVPPGYRLVEEDAS